LVQYPFSRQWMSFRRDLSLVQPKINQQPIVVRQDASRDDLGPGCPN
jgi:hypothetical protein